MFELKQLKLSEGAKAIYKDLSKNITAKAGSSFDFIRTIVRIGHQMIQQKKTDIQAKIDENNDTLSKRLADEANYELQNELKTYINDMKASLQKRSSEFFPAKRNAVEQFVKQMPSDSLGKKIQYVCDYGHLFDKAVWEIFINDSELASNYIAQTIVEKKAEENGIDYVCGFNFNRVQDNINDLETMVNISIANIEKDDNLTLMSLISENPNSPVSQLIVDLDSDISTIIPAEKITVLKRLQQAGQKAYDNDDISLSVSIERFIEKNKSQLATPEELTEELYAQAENLISQGMSAKKGRE